MTKNNNNPCDALSNDLNLKFVGPFEYLNGDLFQLTDEQILIHYRYYFDLPESIMDIGGMIQIIIQLVS